MKKLFIAIAALAAMTSCSQDEVMEVAEKQAISFGNVFVGKSTRATDNTYGANKLIEKFNVYGTVTGTNGTVNIFKGNDVTKPSNLNAYDATKVWTLEGPAQYWVKDAKYAFAAVVNEDIATVATTDANGMPATLTYNTDETGTKDLLYATATVEKATTDQGIVAFTFDHLLSKVWFTVTSTTEYTETKTGETTTKSGYYYSVKNIKVNNFTTGTYAISTGAWEGTTPLDINFGNVEKVYVNDNNKTNETQQLLIPNTANYTITFSVELYVNGEKADTKNYTSTVSTDLLAGHSYNFIIALEQGNPIQFSVTDVNTWKDPDTTDSDATADEISLTYAEVTSAN